MLINSKFVRLRDTLIVCDGNSLTYGYLDEATDPDHQEFSYPSVLGQKRPYSAYGTVIRNKGVNGQTTPQMILDATADIDSLYDSSKSCILIAWEIGNDLLFNTQTATNAYNTFVSYCQARQAVGWKVVVIDLSVRDNSTIQGGPITPAGDTVSQYNAKVVIANDLISANWSTFASAFVQLSTDSRFNTYNTTYFLPDMVHYKKIGYELLADKISYQIKTIL